MCAACRRRRSDREMGVGGQAGKANKQQRRQNIHFTLPEHHHHQQHLSAWHNHDPLLCHHHHYRFLHRSQSHCLHSPPPPINACLIEVHLSTIYSLHWLLQNCFIIIIIEAASIQWLLPLAAKQGKDEAKQDQEEEEGASAIK